MVYALARTAAPDNAAVLRRVRLRAACVDGPGRQTLAAEVFATYTRGPRVRAIAGRVEMQEGRWRVVALQVDNEPVQGDTVSVERVIKAPAREIFALLADAGRHSSFDGSGTVGHSAKDSIPLESGTKFSMRMRGRPETLFMPYTMSNKVIEFEPDRRIAWQTTTFGGVVGGDLAVRTYPDRRRHLVRETWDVSEDRQRPMLKIGSMPRQAEDGMRATLARIAALLEI